MATNSHQHTLEIEQCLHILDVYIEIHGGGICRETIISLLHDGVLQVSTIFEKVAAYHADTTVIQEDEADLAHGADCKMVSVRTSGYGKKYAAPVTKIKNKTGTLYVYAYERKQDKHYYFAIPHWAYKDIPAKSNIEIPFELDGTPRRKWSRTPRYSNWWDFECTSLVHMCQQPGKDMVELLSE